MATKKKPAARKTKSAKRGAKRAAKRKPREIVDVQALHKVLKHYEKELGANLKRNMAAAKKSVTQKQWERAAEHVSICAQIEGKLDTLEVVYDLVGEWTEYEEEQKQDDSDEEDEDDSDADEREDDADGDDEEHEDEDNDEEEDEDEEADDSDGDDEDDEEDEDEEADADD